MPFCMNCGKELPEDARFCLVCGTSVGTPKQKEEQRKTIYDGEIHKCPNCGDIIDAYETVCEACGYEIRGVKATNSVHELQIKLEELYSKRPHKKFQTIFTQVLGGAQMTNIDEEIVGLIKNFSIPNTKEDIMEFVILASSNIDIKVYGLDGQRYQMTNPVQREISDAWLAKFEQAYQKAQIMFGSSQEFFNIHNLYNEKKKEIKKMKMQLPWLLIGTIGGSFLLVGLIWLLVFLTGSI